MTGVTHTADFKTPARTLDTTVPEPENISELPGFLFSSPSFRVVFFSTAVSLSMAFGASALVHFKIIGPDQTYNPLLNGVADKYFPELRR